MKGLLFKDIYMAFRHCGALLIIALVFIGISMADTENRFFSTFPAVFAGIVPLSVLGYDEQSKWNEYADGLPCSRAQMVSVKYILGLLSFIPFFLLSLAGTAAMAAIAQTTLDLAKLCADGALLLAVNLFFPTLTLPFFFRFGVNKGRIAYYVAIGLLAAGIAASGIFTYAPDAIGPVEIPFYVSYILLGIAALLFALSWLLSVCFYRKREF